MDSVYVKIPEGNYCDGCKFLNYFYNPLVNIMGDSTGNFKEGYECKLYSIILNPENTKCCNPRIEKCLICKMDDKDKNFLSLVASDIVSKILSNSKLIEESLAKINSQRIEDIQNHIDNLREQVEGKKLPKDVKVGVYPHSENQKPVENKRYTTIFKSDKIFNGIEEVRKDYCKGLCSACNLSILCNWENIICTELFSNYPDRIIKLIGYKEIIE